MSTFRATLETVARVPPVVVTLAPSEWADTWEAKPDVHAPVGLRLISEGEAQRCRAEAARRAWGLHVEEADEEGRIDAYNGALMELAVARATCQPDDVAAPFFTFPDDMVARAWTPETVERLFSELDALHIASGPSSVEVSREQGEALGRALASGEAWAGVGPEQARRARRLLAVVAGLLAVVADAPAADGQG